MKSKSIIYILIVVVCAILFVTYLIKQDAKRNSITAIDSIKQCYLEKIKSSVQYNGISYFDIRYVEIIFDNGLVTGVDNWLAAEKDSNTGTFSGEINGNVLSVVFSGRGEGQTWREERTYKLEGDKIYFGHGSKPQLPDGDNVYREQNSSEITFNKEDFIERVDCSDVDREEAYRPAFPYVCESVNLTEKDVVSYVAGDEYIEKIKQENKDNFYTGADDFMYHEYLLRNSVEKSGWNFVSVTGPCLKLIYEDDFIVFADTDGSHVFRNAYVDGSILETDIWFLLDKFKAKPNLEI